MYLKYDDISIGLGNLRMNSFQSRAPQFVLDPDALSGFDDGPGTKRNNTPRPTSWGDFSETAYKSARLMTITGTAIANTPWELQRMRDDFMSVLQHGGYQEMSVQTGDIQGTRPRDDINNRSTRYISVGLEGTPRWVRQSDTFATWKMELYAPDPRMFGPKNVVVITDSTIVGGLALPAAFPIDFDNPRVSEAVTMYNFGNTESWPVFKVTGDYYLGFQITDSRSNIIRFDGIVTNSAPVTIDMAAGTAIQSGVDKSNMLSRRDWFSIAPNGSVQPTFIPIQTGFGRCDIIYRDTWI